MMERINHCPTGVAVLKRGLLLLAAMFVASATSTTVGQPYEDTTEEAGSFFESFETLDRERWYISHGWANGPHQNCTWAMANVKVSKGVELSLVDRPTPGRPYTCGELQSRSFHGYGTYEVRMRAAAGSGMVSAFFTYTGPPHGADRPHDEIDVEVLGKNRKGVFLNYFVNGRPHEQNVNFDFDAMEAFNDYAFEWLPGSIRWYANGRLVREVRKDRGDPIPSRKQKIYVSIWNGIGADQDVWLGRFSYPGRPLVAAYEYVAFTRMGASCQFPTSIVCKQDAAGRK